MRGGLSLAQVVGQVGVVAASDPTEHNCNTSNGKKKKKDDALPDSGVAVARLLVFGPSSRFCRVLSSGGGGGEPFPEDSQMSVCVYMFLYIHIYNTVQKKTVVHHL